MSVVLNLWVILEQAQGSVTFGYGSRLQRATAIKATDY